MRTDTRGGRCGCCGRAGRVAKSMAGVVCFLNNGGARICGVLNEFKILKFHFVKNMVGAVCF